MKIKDIKTIIVDLPYNTLGETDGFSKILGGKSWNKLSTLYIRVETTEGIIGWGESFGYNCIEATINIIDTLDIH